MQVIETAMQMMVRTACSNDRSYTVEKRGKTLACKYHSVLEGNATQGLEGFVFALDSVRITHREADIFLMEKDK